MLRINKKKRWFNVKKHFCVLLELGQILLSLALRYYQLSHFYHE